ncbi:MAG: hypothetical protein ACI87J_001478 [Colwellia sp.]|jgi:hypothetical protein
MMPLNGLAAIGIVTPYDDIQGCTYDVSQKSSPFILNIKKPMFKWAYDKTLLSVLLHASF